MDLLDRTLSRIEEFLVSVLLVSATLPWGEELIINMLIWAGLIGSSLALRMGIHIGVDIFVKKFPPRVAKALTLLALTLGLGFCVTLAVLSVRFVIFLMSSGQTSIGLDIPMWIPYLCVPIAISLGLSVLVAYAVFIPLSLLSVAQKFYTSLDSFPLMAIPFFVLASNLMATACILACMFFAAISGSSPATVIAIGGIMIPAMVRAGYDWNYAVGSMTNAGTLGILTPPASP